MIYTFNAKGYILYPVMKSYFNLNAKDVYITIQNGLKILKKQLSMKGISYDELKGALIPNQERNKFETCFIFDSNQIALDDYGHYIFEKLIPLLDKKSTYSVLCGDYIDFICKYQSNSQRMLYSVMKDVLTRCNNSKFIHSSQYFLIYINRLTKNQRSKIIEEFSQYSWFTGFADVTYRSHFKSYISNILVHNFIKNKEKVIVAHPSDYKDEENIDMYGFPFESNGFILVSVNDENYGTFLSYKIESEVPDEEDIGFSFNALFPKFDSFEKLKLNISEDKWNKYLTKDEDGKGEIVSLLGYNPSDKDRFIKEIFKQISANYIYNIRENEHGALMFNVCIEPQTINGHFRKTRIALKYNPDSGIIDLITLT